MSVYKRIVAAHVNGNLDLDCGHTVYRNRRPMGALLLCGVCNPELEEQRLDKQLTAKLGDVARRTT